ncbi:PIG-L deacetylase family protein [Kitasatospora sp. McL0602]|uniref:PIG-L deacetylase family protein n=1 Tax=Kitasatospora sp. McL0602 TaxID=3439530 RepID=UPI003F8C8D9B
MYNTISEPHTALDRNSLPTRVDVPRRVLAVGAHPDDIELGCGATLRAHVAAGDRVVMLVLSNGAGGPGDVLAREEEQRQASERLGAELRWGASDDRAITDGFETVHVVESVLNDIKADIVYTHFPDDSHQDHRATSRAVVSAARNIEQVLLFEGPSSQNFQPHVYSNITGFTEDKLEALRAHGSQVEGSRKVDPDAVAALARVRGFQAGVPEAEGFVARRFVFDLTGRGR